MVLKAQGSIIFRQRQSARSSMNHQTLPKKSQPPKPKRQFSRKQILIVRSLAHLAIVIGFLSVVFEFGPVAVAELTYRKDHLLGIKHTLPHEVITSASLGGAPTGQADSLTRVDFGSLANLSSQTIVPSSTDFGIVIEKINANSKVIPQIDSADEAAYTAALAQGVAEAKGSTPPGQAGNLYIFSHSVDAPWNVIRYNAVFYLLRNLETGDSIVIFYQGKRYNYTVFDKTIADPTDISFLSNRYDKPVLTLQTCDPPGTLSHRLIVRAKLLNS